MSLLDYRAAGDIGVLIRFGDEINGDLFQKVLSFEKNLEKSDIPGIRETIKSFCTLFIAYDPSKIDYQALTDQLQKLEQKLSEQNLLPLEKKVIEIPALYGGEYSPDLPLVAKLLNISEEEVVQLHLAHDYLVYINGHIGGTAFFKGKGKLFELPRKKTPVLFYPAGSLLFADGLGAVFKAADGPSGWYNIGLSPLRQWYPTMAPPVLIKPGNWIRYKRIDESKFHEIQQEVEQNTHQLKYVG
jgi:KipI family sensor histidine kinase inhibitor